MAGESTSYATSAIETSDALLSAGLIPLLPILAFPIILLLGHLLNGTDLWKRTLKEGGLIALPIMIASFAIAMVAILGHFQDGGMRHIFDWANFNLTGIEGEQHLGFGIYLDHISIMLLFVATFLCVLINIFSIGYMNTDPVNEDRNHRFYAEFVLFCAGMFGMVLADDFLWLFIFWEIMGLCSYLLIGFYYHKPSAAYAAKKAFLTTRVGDVFLVIGLAILWNLFGSLEFSYVFDPDHIAAVNAGQLELALGLMFIGAVGKSAQFPLHVWLPDAMEGPTPVSALIHAATMVNAGLYLVARMVPFFNHAPAGSMATLPVIIAIVGGITACMAAAIAFVQQDLKKVLAYSTMSQLGYIFVGLGAALWLANHVAASPDDYLDKGMAKIALGAAMFHLFNHAMAKGMLFMASGSVIHEMHHAHHDVAHHDDGDDHGHDDDHFDAQTMENMGGLASKMPITATAMAIGSASIIGIPLIGGFWSKEGIIGNTWKVALDYEPWFWLPAILVFLTAGMTGFYMSRMWFKTFAGSPRTEVASKVHEATPWIPIPLVTLSVVSLGAIFVAAFHITDYLGDPVNGHTMSFFEGLVYELGHAFANVSHMDLLIISYATILLSTFVGPFAAMGLYGGALEDGEKAAAWLQPLVNLSEFGRRMFAFDNSAFAESGIARSLEARLHFDAWYDRALEVVMAGGANLLAWFDRQVVDGILIRKGIEEGTQATSTIVRRMTTGSARDYIMMAAVGTLVLFGLVWGVVA